MDEANRCPSCEAALAPGVTPCPSCGSLLAGSRKIVVEPLRQEAALAHALLESAGLHPVLAYHDESGVPHPIEPEEPFQSAGGLMVPLATAFAVFVPDAEAGESLRILEDARRAQPEAEG
ncbi:MAG: hypothetical protein AUH92_03125 [Acidobacteria bacterium 13_1_40CM_4_69_4]|nr:MAG: hypothetical protein AUH92_03125 [Acidobacteria bacterium 13_1_40CM_4_69_4]